MGWRISWKLFFTFIQQHYPGSILHAGYYYSYPKESGYNGNGNKALSHRGSFEAVLRRSGFTNITAEEQYLVNDGNGGQKMRGSNDVTIATAMLEWAFVICPQYATIILASSDSDFAPTIGAIRRHNPRALCVCFGSRNNMSNSYHEIFNHIVHIENYKKDLEFVQDSSITPQNPKNAATSVK